MIVKTPNINLTETAGVTTMGEGGRRKCAACGDLSPHLPRQEGNSQHFKLERREIARGAFHLVIGRQIPKALAKRCGRGCLGGGEAWQPTLCPYSTCGAVCVLQFGKDKT